MIELNRIYNEDCLEGMKRIPDKSIDMILCDLPYGTTACKWDTVIPLEPLWEQYDRIIKDNGTICLFSSQPFTSFLVYSNPKEFKYEWVWHKSKGCNFTHAKNMPIKFHENICVFSKAPIGHVSQLRERRMKYNPQGIVRVDKSWSRPQKYETEHKLARKSHSLNRIIEYEGYPKSIIEFNNSDNRERGLHPTQKPVALCEYLIKTYTDEGDTILDNCIGSGTTAVAAINTNRNYTGFELDNHYCEIANERIRKALAEKAVGE